MVWKLFGLTYSAVGIEKRAPYGIAPEARTERTEFLFKGSGHEDATVVGDSGLLPDAAFGNLVDLTNFDFGTPRNTVLFASTRLAGGRLDSHVSCLEEAGYPVRPYLEIQQPRIRSDLIYFDTSSGGAVFAVGSVNWIGSIASNNYDNNIAQMTRNALHGFLKRN